MPVASRVAPTPIAGTPEATGGRDDIREGVNILPRWQPSMGKLPGTRDRLTRSVLETILADWREFGAGALERVREEDPSTYVRVIASLLPKDVKIESDSLRTVVLDFRGTLAAQQEPLVIDQAPEDADADGEE